MATKTKKKVVKIDSSTTRVEISFQKVQRKGRVKNARKFKIPREAAQLVVKTPKRKTTAPKPKPKPKKTSVRQKSTAKKRAKPAPKPKPKPKSSQPKRDQAFNQQVINLLYKEMVAKRVDRSPAILGILFEKGKAIATDSYILAIVKMDYPKENEGKIIDKKGNIIEKKYPNYDIIMPKLANYRKVNNPNLDLKPIDKDKDNCMLYDFKVKNGLVEKAKKVFAKFKETPTLYLPPNDGIARIIVFKSKTVYVLMVQVNI